nr:glycosyltransferase family 2 protein [Mammaliicoccus sp. Marseille-Q6498]
MDKLISIVIPVYNKESYIEKCLSSLINLNIDHSKIEAIFVDDCSTDNSLDIIKKYAEDYAFIQVYKLDENTGSPSAPRNFGIQKAKGTYITLLDADDWLDTEGLPKFIYKVIEDDADFGLAQSFKHTNKSISYHGKFVSYKNESNLKPSDIKKIFRAVGPPGKVFKRSLVIENNIEFEHMKYGEDKLFFIALIAKSKNITMSTIPFYHVNRFDENASLIKETSVIEKAIINKDITKRICNMNIPEVEKKLALSRMVEVDFFRRFLHTKTFLKSNKKQEFYDVFEEVKSILEEHGYTVKELLTNEIFIIMNNLYETANKEEFIQYTKDVVHGHWHFYIENDVVYKKLEQDYNVMNPIPVDCYPIYEGTQSINGEMYEVIRTLKRPDVNIKSVSFKQVNNVLYEKFVDFQYENGRIYINHNNIEKMKNADVNLCVNYDEMGSALVYASYPSNNETYKMKRQSFKVEFVDKANKQHQNKQHQNKYFSKIDGPIITLKKIKLYQDVEFNDVIEEIAPGTKIIPKTIQYSINGTPRIILDNGYVITANKDFVTTFDATKSQKYITTIPNEIKVIKTCKLYDSRSFKDDPIRTLKPDERINIKNIIYTNNSTPRLVTEEGYYLTSNKDFVEVIR